LDAPFTRGIGKGFLAFRQFLADFEQVCMLAFQDIEQMVVRPKVQVFSEIA
jgi:hypothetical protein